MYDTLNAWSVTLTEVSIIAFSSSHRPLLVNNLMYKHIISLRGVYWVYNLGNIIWKIWNSFWLQWNWWFSKKIFYDGSETKIKFIICINWQSNNTVKLRINSEEIERVYDNTFLGVIIDHKLCCKSHIYHVKTKKSKSIPILNRMKHILNEKKRFI